MTTTAATRALQYAVEAGVHDRAGTAAARERTIAARDRKRLAEEIGRAKARFGLAPTARGYLLAQAITSHVVDSAVVSCYEAGRDGFWLHRSIEVNRRRRRAKSDRFDVGKLLWQLVRYWAGERKVSACVRATPTTDGYALVRAFHRPNRSEINSARCRSSGPSITLMSSGSARQYTPAVRSLTSGSLAARVVQ